MRLVIKKNGCIIGLKRRNCAGRQDALNLASQKKPAYVAKIYDYKKTASISE